MKTGDLVVCVEGPCAKVDGGVGIVIQIESWDEDEPSVHVQWANDSLWYKEQDLEVVSENR